MAKYRILTTEELQELEKEFINFLVLNGITADDWIKVKKDQTRADRMIELFSDVVFEKILRQITYLKHVSRSSIKVFYCGENHIDLIGLDSEEIDLTSHDLKDKIANTSPNQFKTYQASKSYSPSREQELFKMLENGCIKSDGSIYNILSHQLNS